MAPPTRNPAANAMAQGCLLHNRPNPIQAQWCLVTITPVPWLFHGGTKMDRPCCRVDKDDPQMTREFR